MVHGGHVTAPIVGCWVGGTGGSVQCGRVGGLVGVVGRDGLCPVWLLLQS